MVANCQRLARVQIRARHGVCRVRHPMQWLMGLVLRVFFHEVVEGFWNRAFGSQRHETLKIVSGGGKNVAFISGFAVFASYLSCLTSIPIEISSDRTACPAAAWSHGVRQQHPS
jgi:hypothetical protein